MKNTLDTDLAFIATTFATLRESVRQDTIRRQQLNLCGLSAVTLLRQLSIRLDNEENQGWAAQCRVLAQSLQAALEGR